MYIQDPEFVFPNSQVCLLNLKLDTNHQLIPPNFFSFDEHNEFSNLFCTGCCNYSHSPLSPILFVFLISFKTRKKKITIFLFYESSTDNLEWSEWCWCSIPEELGFFKNKRLLPPLCPKGYKLRGSLQNKKYAFSQL